jgi:hypothetical protein
MALRRVLGAIDAPIDGVIGCANGTFIDGAEASALAARFPGAPVISLKRFLGESPGASALMQVIAAALTGQRTLVTVVGFNQQAGAALVEPSE